MAKPSRYERVVVLGEDAPEDFRALFLRLLDHVGLEMIVEETPDYKAFEIRKKASV